VLEDGKLTISEEDALLREIPLSDISTVRLKFSPNRFQNKFYLAKLQMKRGPELIITSASFKSLGDFEDRSPSYAAFILALHETLAPHYGKVQFLNGITKDLYVLYMIIMAAVLPFTAYVLFVFLPGTFSLVIIFKLLFLIFLFFQSVSFMKKNKPGYYDPRSIPADVLPRE